MLLWVLLAPSGAAEDAWKQGRAAQLEGRTADAVAHYRRVVEIDPSSRFAARARLQVRALSADAGARRARIEAVRAAQAADEARDQTLRGYANAASGLVLALLVGLFGYRRGWRAVRADPPWRGVGVALYAFGGAAVIAQLYAPGWGVPLVLCGLAVAAVHVLAVGAKNGAVAALATPAACYFVLAAFDRAEVLGL